MSDEREKVLVEAVVTNRRVYDDGPEIAVMLGYSPEYVSADGVWVPSSTVHEIDLPALARDLDCEVGGIPDVVEKLRRQRDEARAEAQRQRERAEKAEAESDLKHKLWADESERRLRAEKAADEQREAAEMAESSARGSARSKLKLGIAKDAEIARLRAEVERLRRECDREWCDALVRALTVEDGDPSRIIAAVTSRLNRAREAEDSGGRPEPKASGSHDRSPARSTGRPPQDTTVTVRDVLDVLSRWWSEGAADNPELDDDALARALEANEKAKRVSPETMDLTFREDDPEPELVRDPWPPDEREQWEKEPDDA